MNLSAVDLNLLVAFDALMAERSVTRAAERVGLSQPAMSNALGRLRDALDDPLLVRAGSGMQPTPRALALVEPIHGALSTIDRALAPPPDFDRCTSRHAFRIQSADNFELSLLPRLIERLKQEAPGIDLVMTRVTPHTEEALRTGDIDLYLGTWFDIPSHLKQQLLHYESFACIARCDHPAIGDELTLRTYVELGHVLVTPGERPGSIVDTALSDQGLGRRVMLRTPHFLVAPLVVARTDLIATIPLGIARTFAAILPLRIHRPPIDVSGFPMQMVWHPRTDQSAPHRFLRRLIVDQAPDTDGW